MDPPPCVQNAMMKQDKKPFTYTPGGIDLSEIKSPRMARRIERNANYTGAPESPRPTSQPVGPLPPSALAAMQPQMHVQVFPSGPPPPPPGPRGGAPPPPPPPANIPPPPPPPTQPLPTQKVVTSENQVLERPDMTKIIPDNPMALLRKTGGPQPRNTVVDEMFSNKTVKTPPAQRWPQSPPIQPPVQQNQRSPPTQQTPPVQQNQWSPPIQQAPPVQQNQWSPPIQQAPPVQQNQWSPPIQQAPPVQQSQKSPPIQSQPSPSVQQNQRWPQNQQWSPPVQQEGPKPYQPRNQQNHNDQIKTSTAHLGSLYIPPANQQQQQQQQQPRSGGRPPSPPRRDPQTPPTPTLKEAPRPWQKQQKQTEELPPWAKKEPVSVPVQQPPQEQRQPVQPVQEMQQPPPQRFQPRQNQNPPSPKTPSAPNAVYVTQPLVFQHPGPPPNRQQPRVDAQGAVIIPVQIEAPKKAPVTPGSERSLNRQQSWGNNPTQSNAFKVIQKITHTDSDDVDENAPVTEHGPRYPQQFQQTPPAEQMRKLKLSEGDRELMNRFRQGVDDDTSLHNEVDPRYRGPAIPSKAFKLLQSMTDGSSDSPPTPGATVSRGPPPGNRSPQVRTIPIQIERDDQPRNYVHPSEQTVPEPKKYTGSSIPSRSFKILQAMTAPDGCANANEVNENYDPSSYNQWGYDPNYPHPVPPYWSDYYYNYYYPPATPAPKEQEDKDIRQTPVPFWNYYPPPPSPYPYMQRPLKTPDIESDAETPRNTPLPFWGYYPYYPPGETEDWNYPQQEKDFAPPPPQPYQYPPYWDPYYYYYGYPPMYPPYPPYYEGEEAAGYSSMDEMAYFNRKMKEEKAEVSKPAPPPIIQEKIETESEMSESDSETEVETEEEQIKGSRSQNGLQAIRSVKDIRVYDNDEQNSDDEANTEEESEGTEENEDEVSYVMDETIPHQLSVIFEESERSDSKRESSILSDSTTIADKSEAEDDEDNSATVSVKLPLKLNLENEEVTAIIVGESEVKVEEEKEKTPQTETEAVICTSDEEKKPIPNDEVENKVEEKKEEEEEEEQDWWGILNKDEDTMPVRNKKYETEVGENKEETVAPSVEEPTTKKENEDASSTSSNESSSESTASKKTTNEDSSESESESESESSESDSDEEKETNDDKPENPEPLSIKERIQALKDAINSKREKLKEAGEIKGSVKDKVSAIEGNKATTSTKSSLKSFEEFSEEEGDSGVTSDMSRHISDNEEFPELKKMTRYQRAATHSRLFKLLQEVCEGEEDDENAPNEGNAEGEDSTMRRDQLSLPLNTSDESFSSSGINSPGSPVSDKLITELVQSILKRKKGQIFRNIPKEKLQAAAKKILQEELDEMSTPDSSFLSPLRNSTESSTPAQTPQEFYNDYKQYYDSWSDADRLYDESDILPSKAFKLLQEHSGLNKTGAIAGLLAKCPKILSSKNVHQELLKLMEELPESPSSNDKSLEPSEVSTAS